MTEMWRVHCSLVFDVDPVSRDFIVSLLKLVRGSKKKKKGLCPRRVYTPSII